MTSPNMKSKERRKPDSYIGPWDFPVIKKYLWLLKNDNIRGSKVSLEDAKQSLHIYGEEVAVVKGKTTKNKQSEITYTEHPELPRAILLKHKKVHLMVDYMFVQGVQFLTTISTKFNYKMVEILPYVNKKGAKKEDCRTSGMVC